MDGGELHDRNKVLMAPLLPVKGSHEFQNWHGNLLTDSGGFQMVSL